MDAGRVPWARQTRTLVKARIIRAAIGIEPGAPLTLPDFQSQKGMQLQMFGLPWVSAAGYI